MINHEPGGRDGDAIEPSPSLSDYIVRAPTLQKFYPTSFDPVADCTSPLPPVNLMAIPKPPCMLACRRTRSTCSVTTGRYTVALRPV